MRQRRGLLVDRIWSVRTRALGVALTLLAGAGARAEEQPLNLLYYGNSYTYGYGSTRSVPQMVADIAGIVGHPTPYFVSATVGSSTLAYHNAQNTAVISAGIAEGQHWDRVVLQDQSLMCTMFGSVPAHRSAFVALLGKVRDHSPNATAVGYETWSRRPDHSYFTAPNPVYAGGAAQMTADIKNGYDLSTADAIAAYGPGASKVARVGEAWQAANWDRLHIDDQSHAQNRGSLLAAMVIYSTIYDDPTLQDIDYTELVNLLLLAPEDAAFLSAAAQRTIGTVTPGNEIYWTNAQTGATVAWRTDETPQDGQFVIGAVTLATNDDTQWTLCARADLNIDGAMDLIWRHARTGEMRAWLMRGDQTLRVVELPTVADTRWELRGTPDVNLDGFADFLWRNRATGANVVWRMGAPSGSGDHFVPGGIIAIDALASVRDPYWQIEGAADFNGDDTPDILWRNVRTGATAAWMMNGTEYVSSANITPGASDVAMRVVAIADYDHDGKSDFVWRNVLTGAMELWLMDGVTRRAAVPMGSVSDLAWKTLGQGPFAAGRTRDFDGDGHDDLFWRHASNGQNALWLLRDGAFASMVGLETIGNANWKVAAVGDLTRDNAPDVLWRNVVTGENVLWIMDGVSRRVAIDLPRVGRTAWEVGTIADVDGDETNDLVWVDSSTGQCIAWVLDGSPEDGTWVRSLTTLEAMASARHRVVGSGRFVGDGAYELIVRDLDAAGGDPMANQVWQMRGGQRIGVSSLDAVSDSKWRIAAAADFGGDGATDLLWRHATTGENLLWRMNGAAVVGVVELPRVADVGWEVAR